MGTSAGMSRHENASTLKYSIYYCKVSICELLVSRLYIKHSTEFKKGQNITVNPKEGKMSGVTLFSEHGYMKYDIFLSCDTSRGNRMLVNSTTEIFIRQEVYANTSCLRFRRMFPN